ncbi:MAG TPA: prolyl oligopeptidase family serine peptidase [Longimicrobiales bacterium]
MRNHGTSRVASTLLAAALAAPGAASAQTIRYPATKKVDVVDDYHGTKVADPYRWLEDTNAAETAAWVAAQNEVTFGYLAQIPEREAIRNRLTDLWNYPKYGTPFRDGGRIFHFKNDGLQNQSVLYVQESLDDEPRVLLDPNTLSADGTVALTTLDVSDDGRWLGYGTAAAGSDWQEFHVRDIRTGRDLPDRIRWVKFSGLSWTKDGKGFFYARYDEPDEGEALLAANLNQKLYYHVVGTPQSADRLIYARPDQPEWGFNAEVSDDGRFVLLYVWHGTDPRNRLYYIDLGDPAAPDLSAPVVPLLDDFDASYAVIGVVAAGADADGVGGAGRAAGADEAERGPVFYVMTNKDAPRQKIVAIDPRDPAPSRWRTIIPEREEMLQGARIIGGRVVAEYLADASSRIRLFSLSGEPLGEVPLPTIGTVGSISGRPEDTEMFYAFTSFLYPTTIFRYDLETGENTVFRAPEIAGFDPDRYETKQVFYTSKDGTRVPMFITHRKGIPLDGGNPTYLYGYGGFNISMTPSFSVTNLVWLEMGGVYAMPNLRGGGEYGEEWHRAGTKQHKQNVFDDFIAAAEYLIREGYTSPSKLAIGGGSNGGLLVGAAMTQRPDLFAVAHPAVGVMDMLRFHKFTIGWAWVSDYGSADDPEMFPYLLAYSPYHNLKPGTCYPATLVTTADHDDRVVPGHSFKFAARLQEVQSCDRPTLIRIETRAGHGGGKPTSKLIEEAADVLAFRVRNLRMTLPESFRTAAAAAIP